MNVGDEEYEAILAEALQLKFEPGKEEISVRQVVYDTYRLIHHHDFDAITPLFRANPDYLEWLAHKLTCGDVDGVKPIRGLLRHVLYVISTLRGAENDA